MEYPEQADHQTLVKKMMNRHVNNKNLIRLGEETTPTEAYVMSARELRNVAEAWK